MTKIPDENFARPWADDTRLDVPLAGGERQTLAAVLDWHRQTLELKCSGLPPERLSERAIPPSRISLHGLIRHLAAVERWWFRIRFACEAVPLLYYSDDDPDQDFEDLDGDGGRALQAWREECQHARQVVAGAASLDQTGTLQNGTPISLRRIMVDMITEYARHAGHADLLRERIDGATGY